MTAWAFRLPFGRWIVATVGMGIVVGAFSQFEQARTGSFERFLAIGGRKLAWISPVCRFGLAAQGVILLVIGWFVVIAAVDYDAAEARGLYGALVVLVDRPYGPVLLGVVAAGLVAFAGYDFIQAGFRRVSERATFFDRPPDITAPRDGVFRRGGIAQEPEAKTIRTRNETNERSARPNISKASPVMPATSLSAGVTAMDIYQAIKRDHSRLREISEEIGWTTAIDRDRRRDLLGEFRKLLLAHAYAEANTFYAGSLQAGAERMDIYSGYSEHELAGHALQQLDELDFDDVRWSARASVLISLVSDHMREEEESVFPKVKNIVGDKIEDMGRKYEQIMNQTLSSGSPPPHAEEWLPEGERNRSRTKSDRSSEESPDRKRRPSDTARTSGSSFEDAINQGIAEGSGTQDPSGSDVEMEGVSPGGDVSKDDLAPGDVQSNDLLSRDRATGDVRRSDIEENLPPEGITEAGLLVDEYTEDMAIRDRDASAISSGGGPPEDMAREDVSSPESSSRSSGKSKRRSSSSHESAPETSRSESSTNDGESGTIYELLRRGSPGVAVDRPARSSTPTPPTRIRGRTSSSTSGTCSVRTNSPRTGRSTRCSSMRESKRRRYTRGMRSTGSYTTPSTISRRSPSPAIDSRRT